MTYDNQWPMLPCFLRYHESDFSLWKSLCLVFLHPPNKEHSWQVWLGATLEAGQLTYSSTWRIFFWQLTAKSTHVFFLYVVWWCSRLLRGRAGGPGKIGKTPETGSTKPDVYIAAVCILHTPTYSWCNLDPFAGNRQTSSGRDSLMKHASSIFGACMCII